MSHRGKRERVTVPKQRRLNDKNARRYFAALLNTNFTEGDLHVTLTYSPENEPKSVEDAERQANNFLRRLAYARQKAGLPPMKRILVTEGGNISERTGKKTRIHHHIIMSGGIDRALVEDLWRKRRHRGQRQGDTLGFCNADRLQPGENGLEALARYLTKDPRGKRRWSPSQNLEKPVRTTNDSRFSCSQLARLCAKGEIFTREFWEKKYPGYTLAGSAEAAVEVSPPDDWGNGWRVFAKLRRLAPPERERIVTFQAAAVPVRRASG